MRSGVWTAMLVVALLVGSSDFSYASSSTIGAPRALGAHGLERRMRQNVELASFIELRGYPDWAEEVDVDTHLPLATHEVRLYYLRMDREIAFTEAYVLGRPEVGLQLYERPMDPSMRARIVRAYIARDPVLRAELAAARAVAAAERAERAMLSIEAATVRSERLVVAMERSFYRRLRK